MEVLRFACRAASGEHPSSVKLCGWGGLEATLGQRPKRRSPGSPGACDQATGDGEAELRRRRAWARLVAVAAAAASCESHA